MKCCSRTRSTSLKIHPCLFAAVATTAAVLLLGCSDGAGGRQKITGAISWDGEPLEGGWIHFRPIGEGPSSAGEIKNGKFKIAAAKGLLAGTYKVAIRLACPRPFHGSTFSVRVAGRSLTAIVRATTHFQDAAEVAAASRGLGEAMAGIEMAAIAPAERLQERGW